MELATIQVHHNKDTGQYYLHFITLVNGYPKQWTDQDIPEEAALNMIYMCYPNTNKLRLKESVDITIKGGTNE